MPHHPPGRCISAAKPAGIWLRRAVEIGIGRSVRLVALFLLNSGLSDEDRGKLIKLYHQLGGTKTAREIEHELMDRDKPKAKYHDYEPPLDESHAKEIDRVMRQRPKYRRRPG